MTTPNPLHILFVVEYYHPHLGGGERLFQNLAEALAAAGHRVSVVTLQTGDSPTHESRNGVEIFRVRTPRMAARYLFTLLAIPTVLRRARTADVIHTTTYNAAIPAWAASVWSRKPAVITVHEVFASQWNNLPGLHPLLGYGFRLFEWAILHLPFAHYLCDSRFTRDRLVRSMGVPQRKTSIVYPAVDYAFWTPVQHQPRDLKGQLQFPPNTFLFLYFGRPGISKGVEFLIEAVPLVQSRLSSARLVLLLGREPAGAYARMVRRIDDLGIADVVTILDPVPRSELPGYLLGADCVVVPSVSEGFGYAAVEAALLGCAVVATSGHATEEVLGDSVRLVPPRDPTALAEAILAIAADRPPLLPVSRSLDCRSSRHGGLFRL